jgi:MFS family permease
LGAARHYVVAALGLSQIVSWGVLYYAFPVLALLISDDTGWSIQRVSGAFTLGLVTAALAGIPAGRVVDRRGPWAVMSAGSVLAALSTAAIALAPSVGWFTGAWVVAGVAMAGVLYQPAFAAVTRWFSGEARIRTLTALTLAGGLASTVFAPLTAALTDRLDWRGTYLVLAAILAAVTVPVHLVALRRPWPPATHVPPARGNSVASSRPFLLLAGAFTLSAFALYSVVISLVPLLTYRGASLGVAAWALGLGGVGQVIGRLGYGRLARNIRAVPRTVGILALGGATTAALGILTGPTGLLLAVAMVAGAVRGITTLLQATAVTERWGTVGYGARSAVLAAPVMLAIAVAPWASASLAHAFGGYPPLFGVLAVVSIVGAALAVWTDSSHRSGPDATS